MSRSMKSALRRKPHGVMKVVSSLTSYCKGSVASGAKCRRFHPLISSAVAVRRLRGSLGALLLGGGFGLNAACLFRSFHALRPFLLPFHAGETLLECRHEIGDRRHLLRFLDGGYFLALEASFDQLAK